jgi:formylglycine-generating enzyme required for sulfatase activity
VRLWTLANRSERTVSGGLLRVAASGVRFFDLIAGRALEPIVSDGRALLTGTILPRGLGCFLATTLETGPSRRIRPLLARQRALAKRASWNTDFPSRQTTWAKPKPTPRLPRAPQGMVEIPAASFRMAVEFQVRECGFYESTGERGEGWPDLHKTRTFTRAVQLDRYAMDVTPVTNAHFAAFLKASRYRPRHAENFLRHWRNRAPPPGLEDHPVVYVDLADARAYAKWAGKRLPTEEEWQFAAEGPAQTRYPWGDEMRAGVCNDGSTRGTTAVKDFPGGRSAFGCYDLCGNIWHWTESEHRDGRTRFCILRGGSWFKARGSVWYADGGPLPCRFAAKFLLAWPGLDRCATIGFRCVTDLTVT